jgi:hypothetical protein
MLKHLRYLNILLTFFGIGIVVAISLQDEYSMIPTSDWWSVLRSDYKQTMSTAYANAYAVFVSLHVTFLALIVAAGGIVLSRSKTDLRSYFRHIASIDWVGWSISLSLSTLVLSVFVHGLRQTVLTSLWLKASLVFPVSTMMLVVQNLTRLESKDNLRSLMKDKLLCSKEPEAFFRDVFLPSFTDHVYRELSPIVKSAAKSKLLSREELFDRVTRLDSVIQGDSS